MRRGSLAAVLIAVGIGAGTALGRGGWQDPPGGWDYVYEANAGEAQYVALSGTMITGLLNGEWMGGIETYFWDGSLPGQYSLADPAGDAPGGAELLVRAGLGDGGGNATVLALEVAGDTTVATGNPFNFAWTTPANEAVYFLHPVWLPGQTTNLASIKQGVTVIARWRLTPDPRDALPPAGQNWVSAGFVTEAANRGKGMLSVVDQSDINASISFMPDGKLFLMDQYDLNYAGSPTNFVTVWMAVLLTALDTYRVEVYLNGATTPAFAQELFDPLSSDETGSDPDDYIAFGLPVKGTAAAMDLDYMGYKVGFLRPGQTQAPPTGLGCAIDTAVDPPALNVTWTVPAGAVYDAIEVLRDGTVLEALPGASASYSTTELVIGQHQYGVRAIAGGAPLPAVSCFVSYCPGVTVRATVDYTRLPPAVHIAWGALPYAVTRLEISRGGVTLNNNLPAVALEYWDSTLTPADGEVTYGLTLVPAAGTPCGAIASNRVVMMRDEEPYLEPAGGWDYVYDPEAHDPVSNPMDMYVAQKGVEGCLDGSWIRSVATDWWDGSAPGVYTLPGDPVLIAPGGVEIRSRPGEGLFGQSIKTLSIEDPGNPTTGGYPDPSNRKIMLGRLLAPPANPAGGRYAEGVTIYVRWRLTPDPRDVADAPVGTAVRDSSHGMITLCYHDGDTAANDSAVGSRSFGMSLVNDMLDVSDGGDIYGLEPGKWVSVWYMTQDTDRNGAYHSAIYLNGDTVPIRPDWRTAPENADRWEEGLFADMTVPFTAILAGAMSTDGATAFEIDFIKIKYGAVAPQSGAPTVPVSQLACRGSGNDVTLTWTNGDTYNSIEVREGAAVLATLAGAAVQAVLAGQPDGAHTYTVVAVKGGVESAGISCGVTLPVGQGDTISILMGNVNTDSKVDIADAITLLGYLFGGGLKPPPVCAKAADANDDNKLDIADAIKILAYLFSGGAMLAPDHGTVTAANNTCTPYDANGIDSSDGKPYFPETVSTLPPCEKPCN
ncbi:MAG TPA: hypothetical protein DCM87_02000 [Planctomycetes bacterium]|nr:hypothetical protein [Planctomycetota bacterium]